MFGRRRGVLSVLSLIQYNTYSLGNTLCQQIFISASKTASLSRLQWMQWYYEHHTVWDDFGLVRDYRNATRGARPSSVQKEYFILALKGTTVKLHTFCGALEKSEIQNSNFDFKGTVLFQKSVLTLTPLI